MGEAVPIHCWTPEMDKRVSESQTNATVSVQADETTSVRYTNNGKCVEKQ